MKQLQSEVIQLLSDMAARRMDNKIPLDRLGLYISFAQHVSGKEKMSIEKLSHIVQYINEKALENYPALLDELEACRNLVNLHQE